MTWLVLWLWAWGAVYAVKFDRDARKAVRARAQPGWCAVAWALNWPVLLPIVLALAVVKVFQGSPEPRHGDISAER